MERKIMGIVGYSGAGKNFVSSLLQNRVDDILHVDTDLLGHNAVNQEAFVISRHFGSNNVCYGDHKTIDRGKLAGVVFNNPKALKALEDIIAPRMKKTLHAIINKPRNANKHILINGAVLHKYPWLMELLDLTIWVDAPITYRLKRLLARDSNRGLGGILKRIGAQRGYKKKYPGAFIVRNTEGKLWFDMILLTNAIKTQNMPK